MLNKDQTQEVGENSTALQAARDINLTVGISAQDARAIALDVAKVTFYELTGQAKETMNHRIEEITDQIINRLQTEYPEGLAKAIDPDFQYALLSVQKQYGRTGDQDLGALLVDLLIDRSKQEHRDIKQIVLNESLEVAPKLTHSQISILSIIFLIGYTQKPGVVNSQKLLDFFDEFLKPQLQNVSKKHSDYQHLQFAGCGGTNVAGAELFSIIVDTYPGIFMKGLTEAEINEIGIPSDVQHIFLIKCLNNPDNIQINASNIETLEQQIATNKIEPTLAQKLKNIFTSNRLSPSEAMAKCIESRPYIETLNDLWRGSQMGNFGLTSVGIAIAHANIKKTGKALGDLSIWIN